MVKFDQTDQNTAPLLEAVEYYDYQFEAELDAENVYKGYPRPELDEAWTRVGKSKRPNVILLLMPYFVLTFHHKYIHSPCPKSIAQS